MRVQLRGGCGTVGVWASEVEGRCSCGRYPVQQPHQKVAGTLPAAFLTSLTTSCEEHAHLKRLQPGTSRLAPNRPTASVTPLPCCTTASRSTHASWYCSCSPSLAWPRMPEGELPPFSFPGRLPVKDAGRVWALFCCPDRLAVRLGDIETEPRPYDVASPPFVDLHRSCSIPRPCRRCLLLHAINACVAMPPFR